MVHRDVGGDEQVDGILDDLCGTALHERQHLLFRSPHLSRLSTKNKRLPRCQATDEKLMDPSDPNLQGQNAMQQKRFLICQH